MRCVGGADDGYGWVEEVCDCASFAHEFGIHANAEVFAHALATCFLQGGNHDRLCCARQDRAPQHNEMEGILFGQSAADPFTDGTDMAEVELAVAEAGRAHAEEGNLSVHDRVRGVGGCMQPASAVRFGGEFGNPGLDNWAAPRFQHFHLIRAQVYSDDRIAFVGQTCGGHGPDVSHDAAAEYPAHY